MHHQVEGGVKRPTMEVLIAFLGPKVYEERGFSTNELPDIADLIYHILRLKPRPWAC